MSEQPNKTEINWKSEIDWLNRRIDMQYQEIQQLRKKIKALVAILVDEKIIGEELGKIFEESKETTNSKIVEWYEAKLWIAGAIEHKGALRATLGIKEDETIPEGILNQIMKTETGETVTFRGKTIKVTTKLKRQAILALRLKRMPKRHD